ncbi:HNH endonuclease signature motif containing protein [Chryseobacterium sp. CKR4-1]|uniref:HNH endonuclease signature motif containing protein n=1 Tax=Chryseobacterium sp. CKR4-1 TaxID=3068896 RepID=UPI002796C019|nr:HNH endonuclease signature motif containing protein [Chryseobacterium sp. CKR4-1]MDQ1806004.1 HNH endonuclease signature motif containing protein [Chryseobacterium sp. CKR4-1]
MKNLTNFDEDSFAVYKDAVKRKRDITKKNVLIGLESRIEPQFILYAEKFNDKKIYEITSLGFDDAEKSVLIDLYQYNSYVIRSLKNKILDKQIATINATCQYCTLNSVETLDHFIPKEEFPEFSVNPLNLLPCCPTCNSKKSYLCFDGEESLFLNLYLDELPNKKYLKAEFDFNNDIPLVTFSLYNPENIDRINFRTIRNHYERLNLLERMREKSNEIITEIINSLRTYYKLDSDIESLKNFIGDEENENKEAYGYNYWKSVLRLSLIQYDEFWKKYIINQ